jgi:hypothetical protein
MSKLDQFKSRGNNVVNFPTLKKRGKRDGFAQISLRAATEISKKMRNADFAILAILVYKVFRTNNKTFIMSNDLTTVYDIGQKAKGRALARFEKAGVIRIERHRGKAPIVTMLIKLG